MPEADGELPKQDDDPDAAEEANRKRDEAIGDVLEEEEEKETC